MVDGFCLLLAKMFYRWADALAAYVGRRRGK
nr:MAG TPA: hypothetical protein [Caudoviricetes sp.]